jgi:hypothetical protein
MNVPADDERLRFVPCEKARTPKDGLVHCLLDRWWVIHPEKGIVFWRPSGKGEGSPQCNSNREITESLAARMYPWARVELIPMVMYQIDPQDYC